jgi:hypothetical protein
MAEKKDDKGNVLSNLISGIILQIKPYRPNSHSSNRKADAMGVTSESPVNVEIERRTQELVDGGMGKYGALVKATEEVRKERMAKVLAGVEASKKKQEGLPRKGAFRWLRRNGNDGVKKKQVRQPMPVAKK